MSKKEKKEKKVLEEETAPPFPVMELAQQMHRVTVSHDTDLEAKVFETIAVELENPSLYVLFREKLHPDGMILSSSTSMLTSDDLKRMEEKNAATLAELEAAVDEASTSAGDMEVMDARVAVARFASKSLGQKEALEAYSKVLDLPKVSSGKKIDTLMALARVASFYSDTKATDDFMDRAHKLAEAGGGADWDRRNRLKVYRALQLLLHRDVKQAAGLLLDCVATFNALECCTYTHFIIYAVLTNMLHLPRPDLKEKIIDGPEVISVSLEIPEVINLVRSLYDCDYKGYLRAMVEVEPILQNDRYMQPHAAYWMRELHILAYKQFLDSYQSVTLSAMAEAFGVSVDFVDLHASRFIAANRITAKIDKYGGVIVSSRPDRRNAEYREMIQNGDLLLNRIQKLARAVDL